MKRILTYILFPLLIVRITLCFSSSIRNICKVDQQAFGDARTPPHTHHPLKVKILFFNLCYSILIYVVCFIIVVVR